MQYIESHIDLLILFIIGNIVGFILGGKIIKTLFKR